MLCRKNCRFFPMSRHRKYRNTTATTGVIMPPRVVPKSSRIATSTTATITSSFTSTQILASHAASMFSKSWRSLRKANSSASSAATNKMTLIAATGSHRGYSP